MFAPLGARPLWGAPLGDKVVTPTAPEVNAEEREHWRKAGRCGYPYAEYQIKTDRLIPVSILK
jgi:F420H(2)-dependent quinone reductase